MNTTHPLSASAADAVLNMYRQDRTVAVRKLCDYLAEDPALALELANFANVCDKAAEQFEYLEEVDAFHAEAARLRKRAETVRQLADVLGEVGTLERLISGYVDRQEEAARDA